MSEGHDERPKDETSTTGGKPPTAAAPPAEAATAGSAEEGRERLRRILEGAIGDVVRRSIGAGLDRLGKSERGQQLRAALGDLRLPREIAGYLASQFDDTKNAILKVVADEIRRFLETSHFADELARILTTLSFEITTTVRFVPNADGRKLRPRIASQARLRRRGRPRALTDALEQRPAGPRPRPPLAGLAPSPGDAGTSRRRVPPPRTHRPPAAAPASSPAASASAARSNGLRAATQRSIKPTGAVDIA